MYACSTVLKHNLIRLNDSRNSLRYSCEGTHLVTETTSCQTESVASNGCISGAKVGYTKAGYLWVAALRKLGKEPLVPTVEQVPATPDINELGVRRFVLDW